jgi:raffinose/stachyose/melibiose transport system substrate-binding protein
MLNSKSMLSKVTVLALPSLLLLGLFPVSQAVAADAKKTTITFESWNPSKPNMDRVVAAFQKENPTIEVKAKLLPYADYVTSIKTEMASGTGPDVFHLEPGAMLGEFAPLLKPVGTLAAREMGATWKSKYSKSAISQVSHKGIVYGLPGGMVFPGTLWVNETILAANGIEDPKTLKEFIAACAKLRAAKIVPLAIGAKDQWLVTDVFASISNSVAPKQQYKAMEGKGSWKTAGLLKAFTEYAALFTNGIALDGASSVSQYMDAYDLFADGKAAFLTNGSWNMDMFSGAADRLAKFKASVIQMPTSAGLAPLTGGIESVFIVNKSSDKQIAAMKFVAFMAGPKGQQIIINDTGGFSSLAVQPVPAVIASEDAKAIRKIFNGLIASNVAGYRSVPDAGVAAALGTALLNLAAKTTTPAEAVSSVQAAQDLAK